MAALVAVSSPLGPFERDGQGGGGRRRRAEGGRRLSAFEMQKSAAGVEISI